MGCVRPCSAMADQDTIEAAAEQYAELFPAVYLRLHRRDGKARQLSSVSRAVLMHLGQAGPLTIGECAKHLGRAQSVVSEIVEQLEKNGLLARMRDADDRRRTLVWLTEAARERLVADQEVLSRAALLRALGNMKPEERAMLVLGTRALVRAAQAGARDRGEQKTNPRRTP
jgi:DNA-binding MarR family transcriptional regulator